MCVCGCAASLVCAVFPASTFMSFAVFHTHVCCLLQALTNTNNQNKQDRAKVQLRPLITHSVLIFQTDSYQDCDLCQSVSFRFPDLASCSYLSRFWTQTICFIFHIFPPSRQSVRLKGNGSQKEGETRMQSDSHYVSVCVCRMAGLLVRKGYCVPSLCC